MRTTVHFQISHVLSLLIIIFFASVCHAKTETVYSSYKYIMGDNDTKSDAKRICFIEAKRLLLEKVGVYIESNTEVSQFQLTKDEIKTYTAAILKSEIVNEEIKYEGQSMAIYMTIKADVDTDSVLDNIKRIREDRSLAAKLNEQQKQLQSLEDKIKSLQGQLSTTDFDKSIRLRKERKESFDSLDELEKIKFDIKQKTVLAVNNIELGMTPSEVEKISGKPRVKDDNRGYNYGNVWVIFESGIVACIVKAEGYQYGRTCAGYRMGPRDIVK